MGNSRVNPGGWSTNDLLTPAQANSIDVGQAAAITNTGTTSLAATTIVQGNGFQLTLAFSDNAASVGAIAVGAQDFTVLQQGAGFFNVPGAALKLSGVGWPTMGSRAVTQYAPAFTPFGIGTGWTNNGTVCLTQSTLNSIMTYQLGSLPVGMTITDVIIPMMNPNCTNLGTTSAPRFTLFYITSSSATPINLGQIIDPTGSLTAYQAYHVLDLSGLSHVVADGNAYYLQITGDAGAGTAAGLQVYRPYLTGTINTLRTA